MFHFLRKNNTSEKVKETRSKPCSISSGRVPDAAAAAKPSSETRTGRTAWIYRLFRPTQKKSGGESGPQKRKIVKSQHVKGQSRRPLTHLTGAQPEKLHRKVPEVQEEKKKVPEVQEEKRKVSEVQEEKRKVPEVQEEKTKVPEVQEEKTKVPEVQEEKRKVPEVQEEKTKVPEVQEEKKKVPEVQEEKRKVPEVQEEKKKVPEVQEEEKKVPEVQTEKKKVPEVQEEKRKVPEVQEEKKKVPEVQEEEKKVPEVQTEKKKIPEFQEERKKVPEVQEEKKKVPEVQEEEKNVPEVQEEEKKVPEVQTEEKKVPEFQEEKRKVPEVQEEKKKVPEVQEEEKNVPEVQEETEKVELPVIGGKKERMINIPVTKKKEDTNTVPIHDTSPIRKGERYVPVNEGVRGGRQDWLGFPNPGNLCYMNSSLQGLLTLKGFIRDLSQQQEVWSHLPEAEIIRRFMNIVGCHRSADPTLKCWVLLLFKKALSVRAPEFKNNRQKDAHEFLTTVLDQMRSVAPQLQDIAACLGRAYRCPVEEHLVFRMQNTRTCRSCGAGSTREEDYTNLSLKLLPGASVGDMLQSYLMETKLDFRCECGSNRSVQQPAFKTLPKVLILHVRRICFTPSMQLVKLSDPVTIFRELMVSSTEDTGWYSLVSIINHLGNNTNSGHYISDVIHPEAGLDDPSDRWLTCNDGEVTRTTGEATRTTGEAVCQERRDTASILFYQRRQGRGRLRARTGIRRRAATWDHTGRSLPLLLELLKMEDQQMMGPAAERGLPLSTGPQEEGLLPESQVPPEVSSCKREFFLAAVASESLPGQSELISKSSL
ncbi:hypothetical protein KUCAC02_003931 [Chaenocephalus aceratus]|uniref:Uncharacterized protein n=1 Tax=Chaenocephalus aceratus TaxID=36190 RepID=A0ACB9WXP7_CHAAC|nr:hypothetical protein KUCAC02_003931 [Chaenocephalus aceratus]